MKVQELIAKLQKLNPDIEVYFSSCCFPETKWFEVAQQDPRKAVLTGFEGSYVAGDPDTSPWEQSKSQPPPFEGPWCRCGTQLRWDTADGGHWRHRRSKKADHEAVPRDQPELREKRAVWGSINDLKITGYEGWELQ